MEIKFQLLSQSEKLNAYISKLLPNYPKKEYVLKHNIEKNLYELIEDVFAYNIYQANRIKEKYLKEYIIKLSMLDFYMRQSFHKKYISKHQLECISKIEIELRKIAYGLIKREKDNV